MRNCASFLAQSECDAFLEGNEIRVESLSREAGFLISRDRGFYRKLFPSLTLIDPAGGRERGKV